MHIIKGTKMTNIHNLEYISLEKFNVKKRKEIMRRINTAPILFQKVQKFFNFKNFSISLKTNKLSMGLRIVQLTSC